MRFDAGSRYYGCIGVAFNAMSNDGGTAAVVEGNRILNTWIGGPYNDSWSSKDLIVRNNYYRNVVMGPNLSMGGNGFPILVASVTQGSPPDQLIATLTTRVSHGFVVGQAVNITEVLKGGGPPPPDSYRGHYEITSVPNETSFTYKMTNDPGGRADDNTGQVVALWQVGRRVIENNIVDLVPSDLTWGTPTGIVARVDGFADPLFAPLNPRVFRQLVIRNNMIRNVDGVPEPLALNRGISVNYFENALIENNVIDLPGASRIEAGNCTNLRFFNNRTPAGQLIQGVVGTTKQDELTTFIEDAAIVAML